MTAKEFLRQYEYADRKVKRIEQELEDELRMLDAIRSASDNDGMPHGHSISRPTEDKALKLADKRQRLIDARADALEVKQKVFDLINGIDGIEGDLLFQRYVKLHKWEEIAVDMNYSWSGIHKLHRSALHLVAEIISA